MPFTYLAHQAPVLAIKRRWPAAFDGTALVTGSMAPDWAYAFTGSRLALDGHSILGVVAFCTPVAVLAAVVLRRISPVLFAYAPSSGRLPLRQLTVLASRRPAFTSTVASAGLGALTHVAWDLFTHDDRWGPRHISVLRARAFTFLGHDATWAKLLQYASHLGGAVVAVLILAQMLRSGSLLRWYGVARDPGTDPRPRRGSVAFTVALLLGGLAGAAWAAAGSAGLPAQVIRLSLGLGAGLVIASLVCRRAYGPFNSRRALAPVPGRDRRRPG